MDIDNDIKDVNNVMIMILMIRIIMIIFFPANGGLCQCDGGGGLGTKDSVREQNLCEGDFPKMMMRMINDDDDDNICLFLVRYRII